MSFIKLQRFKDYVSTKKEGGGEGRGGVCFMTLFGHTFQNESVAWIRLHNEDKLNRSGNANRTRDAEREVQRRRGGRGVVMDSKR